MLHTQKHSVILILFLATSFCKALAQGVYTNFGQNRLQHTRMEWSFLRSENFDTYFYSGGRELASFAAKYAEENLNSLEKILDHRLSGKVEIVVYNTLGDFKQGNFNLLEIAQNTGGYTQVVNNKVFVYFNGSHNDFTRQLKEGIALVLLNEMLYGGNFQERVQNAALLSLPEWYLKGLTSYISKDWDADMDNAMRDGIVSGKIKRFNRFYQQNQVFAGHSFWKFMVENYSEKVISQMIYITRLTRNYESAIYNITDLPLKELQKNWLQYYKDLYLKEENLRKLPDEEIKIKRRLAQYLQPEMKVSSKGDNFAFVTNKNGKYKVWLYNLNTGKYKKIYKGGLKYHQIEVDRSFPLLAWQPGGDKIGIVYEKKGIVHFKVNDLANKQKTDIKLLKFDKITGFDFSNNGRSVVFSAIRRGQSDIFIYDLNSRKERQITRDAYDDIQPRFADFGSKIVFASNRNADSLNAPINTEKSSTSFDIYQYDIDAEVPKLSRLTKTDQVNHTLPIQYSKDYIAFLSDYNGIKNRYASRIEEQYDFTALFIHYLDSLEKPADTVFFYGTSPYNGNTIQYNNKTIVLDKTVKSIDTVEYTKDVVYTYPLTNYSRGILAHDVSVQTKTVYDLVFFNQKYYIKKTPLVQNIPTEGKKIETYPTMYRLKTDVANKPFKQGAWVSHSFKYLFEPNISDSMKMETNELLEEKEIIDSNAYFFVNDFTDRNFKRYPVKLTPKLALGLGPKKQLKIAAPRFYDVTFFADQVVTQLDNSIINTYYQPLTAGGARLFNQGLNAMFKVGMLDLMEDYRLVGGVRVNFNFVDLDYFVSYETLKKTLDHKLMYYRQNRTEGIPELRSLKHISQELRYIIGYPFNPASSVRANVFYRIDRETTRASNFATLEVPDVYTNWYGGKLEYVYDNIIPRGLNLMHGTRLKLFWDHYRSWEDKNLMLNAVGFDIRHYEKIHRQIIWATRFTANHSFGRGKVVYFLGGVENWITPRFNNDINTSADEKYVFQALGCNLRGFEQNIRNGNTFTVVNTEFRVPIFQYALNQPLRSEFLNNFQIVPFFDVGSAWVGNNPYSENNTFNQKIIEQGPVKAKVINVRDPLVAGMGGGLRSKIFGYFVKFDTAWGIQDGEIRDKPVYYLSLGLDF
ncbi:MAG: hypothetical protein ACK4K9_04325 [Bacteroidia bacterium]